MAVVVLAAVVDIGKVDVGTVYCRNCLEQACPHKEKHYKAYVVVLDHLNLYIYVALLSPLPFLSSGVKPLPQRHEDISRYALVDS